MKDIFYSNWKTPWKQHYNQLWYSTEEEDEEIEEDNYEIHATNGTDNISLAELLQVLRYLKNRKSLGLNLVNRVIDIWKHYATSASITFLKYVLGRIQNS